MILQINGWPGVGKLTVGRIVANELGGRLLDSHTIYNVAFSLTEFRTAEFYDTARSVRDIAFARVAEIEADIPVVMTSAYAGGDWADENWDAIINLARKRGSKFLVVIMDCAAEENFRRLRSEDRAQLLKRQEPAIVAEMRNTRTLLSHGADHLLRIDSTGLSPEVCARQIILWARSCQGTEISN